MSPVAVDRTLVVAVQRVIADEGGCASDRLAREPKGSEPTRRERDMRDWGMAFGVAAGIQLGIDPDADLDTVAEDALDAARAAFARWSAPIAPRPPFMAAVDEMLSAYDRARTHLNTAIGASSERRSPEIHAFEDKMAALVDAIGMPEPEVIE